MCWKCGKEITLEEPIAQTAECDVCHADLHCCKNCKYYAPGSHYDCHETIEEIVVDKEESNFCDNFEVKRIFSNGKGGASTDKASEARKAFENLFGN